MMHESANGRVSRVAPVHTAIRNCTRDEGGPFEVGNQVLISSHRKLLLSKAMVVSVAEATGRDPVTVVYCETAIRLESGAKRNCQVRAQNVADDPRPDIGERTS